MFDSHSRLQVILNKSGPSIEHRIWLVEGLFYSMENGYFDKEVSVTDLKGAAKTSNKGLCDVLLFKLALKQQLFQKMKWWQGQPTPTPLGCHSASGWIKTSLR